MRDAQLTLAAIRLGLNQASYKEGVACAANQQKQTLRTRLRSLDKAVESIFLPSTDSILTGNVWRCTSGPTRLERTVEWAPLSSERAKLTTKPHRSNAIRSAMRLARFGNGDPTFKNLSPSRHNRNLRKPAARVALCTRG